MDPRGQILYEESESTTGSRPTATHLGISV
jgi:hypothetical protein